MDFDPIPYNLQQAILGWAQLLGIFIVLGIALGYVFACAREGAAGIGIFTDVLKSFVRDLLTVSPRRVLALTRLTLKEAARRKALLVFVVFAVLLMFGGWFLTDSNDRAELQFGVHVTFMLTVISWLILPVAMFLSCWGIPEDIRIRSLHTVVTKPVRRIEVVMGRIFGYSAMVTMVLVLMGVVGYIWIKRHVPDTIQSGNVKRSLLTCRVPVYGELHFLDRMGLPKKTGLNVGDAWMFRSYIEGNSASRAIWRFRDITSESIGDEMVVESRFEAFRTVKGTKDSVNRGIEAFYTLVRDPRARAFSSIGIGATFRDAADALRDGSFRLAADRLDAAADILMDSFEEFPVSDTRFLGEACMQQAVPALESMGDEFTDVAAAFSDLGTAARLLKVKDVDAAAFDQGEEEAKYKVVADQCRSLAEILRSRSEDLAEKMPRVEVPLPTFAVSEFHEGDNVETIPRKITYAANNETAGRFIARTIVDLNSSKKLVEGDAIHPDLITALQADEIGISEPNADLIARILETDLDDGHLEIQGDQLNVADGRRWLTYISDLVKKERLISVDAAGWVLTADLFEDLAPDGRLRLELTCLNDQMYLGMARPDLFIRLKDRPFWIGYCKALLSIGLMLCLVVVLGVTSSCIVKGPVAFFATLTFFTVGQFFHDIMYAILNKAEGGGMVESAILMVQHRNPSTGADISEAQGAAVTAVDSVFGNVIWVADKVCPDFRTYSESTTYIEHGFDVPWATSVLPSLATFFGFLIPCILLGALWLKVRELEAK